MISEERVDYRLDLDSSLAVISRPLRFPLKYRYVKKEKDIDLILDAFNTLERLYIIMQNNYNINQFTLAMTTDYQPGKNHPAYYIHQLVENLAVSKPNVMGCPREYDPRILLKLVLLAYSYGIVSCRKIERFARENIVAMWLTQEQHPTYQTIARFIVSKELTEMIQASFKDFHDYLQKTGLMKLLLVTVLKFLLMLISIPSYGRSVLSNIVI
ncbi:transposase [Lactobacillaceae bacterium 24-114]